MQTMKFDLSEVADGSKVLAGALAGRELLTALLAATATEPALPEPLFLDFRDVEVATASYLREGIIAFREVVRGRRSNFYPVITNPNEMVRDELIELMRSRKEVFMTCVLDANGRVVTSALIGDLDPKQRMTFDLVQERGETDAGELMRDYGKSEQTTSQTAWNNRLTSLAALGLVVEISQGRNKRYKPLFQGT
jgi:hypothetical protein